MNAPHGYKSSMVWDSAMMQSAEEIKCVPTAYATAKECKCIFRSCCGICFGKLLKYDFRGETEKSLAKYGKILYTTL